VLAGLARGLDKDRRPCGAVHHRARSQALIAKLRAPGPSSSSAYSDRLHGAQAPDAAERPAAESREAVLIGRLRKQVRAVLVPDGGASPYPSGARRASVARVRQPTSARLASVPCNRA
jgi:hypothetical protein